VSNLNEIFNKIIKILENPSLTNYNSKIEAANFLKYLAQCLQGVADIVIGYYQSEVLKALDYASKDRVLKVQLQHMKPKESGKN